MKILFTTVFLVSAGAASAAEYFHVNTRDDPQFRNAIGNFLNTHRPEINDVHCMLSGGVDFHLWVKPANSANRYNLEVFRTRDNSGWTIDVSRMIDSGSAVPCAFNADSDVWMIEAQ